MGDRLVHRMLYLIFCGGTSLLYIVYVTTLNSNVSKYSVVNVPIVCPNTTEVQLVDIPLTFTYQQARGNQLTRDLWTMTKPAMNADERETLRRLLSSFIDFTDLYNYTYFMTSGTLLGSYRHHAIMPWDDDADLLMRKSEAQQIANRLRSVTSRLPRFRNISVKWGPSKRLKIYHRTRYVPVRVQIYRFGWPCLDITFYDENSTHLWQYNRIHVLPKALVFPLVQRPFEMRYIASPRDPFAVLKRLYKNPRCVTLSFSHRLERSKRAFTFSCDRLRHVYPFVHRRIVNGSVLEAVKISNCTYYEVEVTDPPGSAGRPFLLASL